MTWPPANWRRTLGAAPLLAVVAVASVAAAVLGVANLSFLTQAERLVEDIRTATILPDEPQDPKVVIVALTEDTIKRFPYRSPVDRAFLANLLLTLQERKPAVIALDVLFDQPTEPAKDDLMRHTVDSLTVPLAVSYVRIFSDDDQRAYLDAFVPAPLRVDAVLNGDPLDGVIREVRPGLRLDDGTMMPGFARGVAARAGVETPPVAEEAVWHGRPDNLDPAFVTVPAHLVPIMPAGMFAGKVVLIGADLTLTDRHRTPFTIRRSGADAEMAGIEVHAHAVSQLLSGRHSRHLPQAGELGLVAGLALLGLAFGVLNRGLARHLSLAVVTLVLLWGGGFALFYVSGTMVVLVAPSLSFLLATWGADAVTGRRARRQKEFIHGAFSRYLAPDLVKQLAADPEKLKLGGESRDMTLMFCDIRSFTTISERFDAQGLTRFMNRYLTPMTDAILANGGTIDKYMGDAIMAFWNAPLDDAAHAEHAGRAALAMRAELVRLNDTWRAEAEAEGRTHEQVRFGIGLNTGICNVGNMGSDQRFDYSVLGDDVNLASRLEGQSKTYGLDIVLGPRTVEAAPMLATLELDLIRVKGKTRPVQVFALVGDEQVATTEAFALLKRDNEAMLAAYRGCDWAEARRRIAACRAQAPEPLQAFYTLYEERVAHGEADPPHSGWDGVYVALSK